MIKMMRFSLAAVFALTKGSASAWSSPSALQSKIGFGRCAPSLYRSFAALHSFTVDQAGEVGTDSFRLFFKGEVRTLFIHVYYILVAKIVLIKRLFFEISTFRHYKLP